MGKQGRVRRGTKVTLSPGAPITGRRTETGLCRGRRGRPGGEGLHHQPGPSVGGRRPGSGNADACLSTFLL